MKTIVLDGLELNYKISEGFIFGDMSTEFYIGTEKRTYKKYLLFGETITEYLPKYAFSLWYNIENPDYTKDIVKRDIQGKLDILKRQEEIKRGEII